jgi:hypothetical protein
MVLRPYGINYGYLVFEIPQSCRAARLTLTVPNQPDLSLEL